MNLKCKINGKEYLLAQGVTFSEEYNETLDSGTIIISQIPKIKELEPYDDVFIFDNELKGYGFEKINYKNKNVLIFDKDQDGAIAIAAKIPNVFVQGLYGEHQLTNNEIKLRFFQEEEEGFFVTTYSDCHILKQNNLYYFVIDEINFKKELILDESIDCWVFKQDDILINGYTDIRVDKFEADIIYNYNKTTNNFYKHLLVDSITREELNLDEGLYKYTISLFSETKGLEIVQLPNFSITEPLDAELKKTAYEYMVDIVEMYSPIYKVIDDEKEKTWKYHKKYIVDPNLKETFGNVYSPDFTLTNPNLRDVLSKIMIIKDMIPYVEDGVIKAKDITLRTDEFNGDDYKYINYVFSNKSSNNYCNSLKTTYSDALSQEKSCRLTEFIGFRNSDSAILTVDNMRLETTYPIYKINKMYMCYYKRFKIKTLDSRDEKGKLFLCKQDITPLVKLNSERNVLSEDWSKFNERVNIEDIDFLAKFKISTIGYDIGSKFISGWGSKYTSYALFNWLPEISTYVQKIFHFMDENYPYGIYNYSYLKNKSELSSQEYIDIEGYNKGSDIRNIVSPFQNEYPQNLKALFFEVEYESFYNGTIYHTKDEVNRDDIVINDNPSNSLTILELDGIAQKEKINRFGNDTFQINARYTDINQLKPLGSVYNSKSKADTDVIIYSREYSIYDKVINCKYIGSKDYVLKNYFTSVYAKHRPYNLMSYNESVYRSENRKVYLLFDTTKSFFEKIDNEVLKFENFENIEDSQGAIQKNFFITKILSFIKESVINEKNNINNKNKINYGFIQIGDNKYASDVNVFNSGNSLCFNIKMYDNVSGGVYVDITDLEPFTNLGDFISVYDDVKGSLQKWYLTVDNEKTGFVKKMGFYVGHVEKDDFILGGVINDENKVIGKNKKIEVNILEYDFVDESKTGFKTYLTKETRKILNDDSVYKKIFEFPKLDIKDNKIYNLIGNEFLIQKDNKEIIDMTFQIEPITNNDKIILSPWMMKLSDLNGIYNKMFENINVADENKNNEQIIKEDIPLKTYQTFRVLEDGSILGWYYRRNDLTPLMILEIDEKAMNNDIENNNQISVEKLLLENNVLDIDVSFSYENGDASKLFRDVLIKEHYKNNVTNGFYIMEKLLFNFTKITSYDKENGILTLEGTQQMVCERFRAMDISAIFSPKYEEAYNIKIDFKSVDYITCAHEDTGENDVRIYCPEGKKWFIFDVVGENGENLIKLPKKEKLHVYYWRLCLGGQKSGNLFLREYTELLIDSDGKLFIDENGYKNAILTNQNSNIFNNSITGSGSFKYEKNMFVVKSESVIKKHQIYNKYRKLEDLGLSDYNTGISVEKVFYFDENDILTVNLSFFEQKSTKSIQLWYKDDSGVLNFVFGVNVDERDIERGKLDIHISMLTHRDMRVFDNLHNVVGEVKNVANITEGSEDYSDKFKQKYVEKNE